MEEDLKPQARPSCLQSGFFKQSIAKMEGRCSRTHHRQGFGGTGQGEDGLRGLIGSAFVPVPISRAWVAAELQAGEMSSVCAYLRRLGPPLDCGRPGCL